MYDDWMDIDSSDSGNDDPGLNEIDMEILDSVGEVETDEDEDMDLDNSDSNSVEESDTDTDEEPYDDDTEITDRGHSPPVLNHGSKTEWHDGNSLLKNIGLEKLHDKGYVNLYEIRTDRTFGYSRDRSLSAARWRAKYEVQKGLCVQVNEPHTTKRKKEEVYGKLDEFHRIHPIFRQDNWTIDDLLLGTESNCLFNKLKPVLQLATLLLEDENIVGHIFSMLDVDSHKEITLDGIEEDLGEKAFWFERRHNLSEKERQTVWRELYELSKSLRWTEEEGLDSHGCTKGPRGSIEIVLNKRHIDEVCREVSCIEDAIDWTPGSDEDSARLRVKFLLASTMVHEVMHALWRNKYYPNHEPFHMDTITAELGFQWEQLTFSGIIDKPTEDRGSPYVSIHAIHHPMVNIC